MGNESEHELLERVRVLLPGSQERRMFGGVAFMRDGSMVCAVSSRGALVRVDRGDQDELVERTGVEAMVMGERRSRTWVSVAPEALADDGDLEAWVERGVAAARAAGPGRSG